jgi:L-lactate dehydrogenase complex protein LldE
VAAHRANPRALQFLHDVLKSARAAASRRGQPPPGCHALRELRLGGGSERLSSPLTRRSGRCWSIEGLHLAELTRSDECCGFGGTFTMTEEAISCAMGRDRIADHERAGAEMITGADSSCLMHLEGLLRRDGKKMRVLHVAELLEEATR